MAQKGIVAADESSLKADLMDRAARVVTVTQPVFDQSGRLVSGPRSSTDPEEVELLRDEEIADAVASVECLDPLRGEWDAILADAEQG